MIINIYIDDLREDKRLEVIFALRDDIDKYIHEPIAVLYIDEEAEF